MRFKFISSGMVRLIRSIKEILKKLLKNYRLTFEEFQTVFEVELTMNNVF